MIAAVQGFAARHGYALAGIEADFVATYNRLRARFREADGEPAALAVLHDGRLTVGLWRSGAWRCQCACGSVTGPSWTWLCRRMEENFWPLPPIRREISLLTLRLESNSVIFMDT